MSAGCQIIVHRVRILIVGFSAMSWYLAPTVAPRSIQRCQADRSVGMGIIEEQMVRCLAGERPLLDQPSASILSALCLTVEEMLDPAYGPSERG